MNMFLLKLIFIFLHVNLVFKKRDGIFKGRNITKWFINALNKKCKDVSVFLKVFKQYNIIIVILVRMINSKYVELSGRVVKIEKSLPLALPPRCRGQLLVLCWSLSW